MTILIAGGSDIENRSKKVISFSKLYNIEKNIHDCDVTFQSHD